MKYSSLSNGILIIFMASTIQSNLPNADYFIRNVQDLKMCIEAGDTSHNYDGVIFQHGILVEKKCSNISQQQWHFQRYATNTSSSRSHPLYNITNAAVQSHYSEKLNANITGFFTTYWPNPIQLVRIGPERVNGTKYRIKTFSEGKCFQSYGPGKAIEASTCKKGAKNQIWRLFIVTHGVVTWSPVPVVKFP